MAENDLILPKAIYQSKKDFLKELPLLKIEKINNVSEISKTTNLNPIKKKYANLGKKNLTCQNFLDYNYNLNNITENIIRMPDHLKIKKKYELLIDNDYSSYISKNSNRNNKKVSNILITGLNTPDNKYKKHHHIFTSSQKTFENSDIKTKSSSNKNTKSFGFNYNNSSKYDNLFQNSSSNISIHFHRSMDKFTNNDTKGLKAFVLKSKYILREKIIKQELEKRLNNRNDYFDELIKVINKKKDTYQKNYKLFDLYDDTYIHYLTYLKQEEIKEIRIFNILNRKKLDLENEVTRLLKKIDKKNSELTNLESIKNFLKYSDFLSKKDKDKNNEKEKEIKIDKNPKKLSEKKEVTNFQQNLLKLVGNQLLSYIHERKLKKKTNSRISVFSRYNSVKPQIKKSEKKLNIYKEKTERTNSKNNKNILNRRRSTRKNSTLIHKNQYDYIFTDHENKIINFIEIRDMQRKEIYEELKNLKDAEILAKKENEYTDDMLIIKEKELEKLKEENAVLVNRLEKILADYNISDKILEIEEVKKNNLILETNKETIPKIKINNPKVLFKKNRLEEKIIYIIENISEKINISKILKIKNLSYMLKLKSDEFLERFKNPKIMFSIKVIELIIAHLVSKKTEYLSDPKLKEKLKNFLYALENDKKIRMNNLNKKMLKKQLEKKKDIAYEKSTKIRFLPYRKYDLNHFKKRKNKELNNKDKKQTVNDNPYEEWILYD